MNYPRICEGKKYLLFLQMVFASWRENPQSMGSDLAIGVITKEETHEMGILRVQ